MMWNNLCLHFEIQVTSVYFFDLKLIFMFGTLLYVNFVYSRAVNVPMGSSVSRYKASSYRSQENVVVLFEHVTFEQIQR